MIAPSPMNETTQMTLKLPIRPALERGSFCVTDSNAEAALHIDRWPAWPSRSVMLSGPERSGKSHLAAAWRLRSQASLIEAALLDDNGLPQLIAPGAVVVERVDALPQEREETLLHLFNMAAEEETWLLMTFRRDGDARLPALPDLRSRLRAVPILALQPPDDVSLRRVLEKLLADRHIRAEEGLIPYLTKRMERSWKAAESMVAMLDEASLSGKRRVGISLARELLESRQATETGRESHE